MSLGKREQKIDFLRLSVTLFAITAIVAMVLALANYFTAPIIAEASKKRLDNSLRVLMADAKSFDEAIAYPEEIVTGGAKVPVAAVYQAKDAKGELMGYCVQVTPGGYSDVIDMIVAIDFNGAVSGVQILSISDTPGIGMKVGSDQEFQDQVLGMSEPATIVKSPATQKGEVQVISGASISSTAYFNGVNAAIDVAGQLLKEVE